MEDLYIRGKKVGKIVNSVYFTNRCRERHYFRKYHGYGISLYIINELIDQDVTKILIKDEDGEYLFNVSDYLYGISYTYNNDEQKIVRLEHGKQ